MPNDLTISVLRTWGHFGRQWDRSLASVVVSWETATRMLGAAAPLFKAQADSLNALLSNSENLLQPLADPLRTDFGTHRWLRGDREEAYSDWLAWIVESLESEAVLALFGISELFPDKPIGDITPLRAIRAEVSREVCVPKGHASKRGRLDLVIRFRNRVVLVVETKVGHADSADTAKQQGYAKWLLKQKGRGYSILLACDGGDREYEGDFRLLRWSDLCLRLRHLAVGLLGKRQIVLAAMVLAFSGAVEQNLLGFSITAVKDVQRGRSETFDQAVFDYLEHWVKMRKEENDDAERATAS